MTTTIIRSIAAEIQEELVTIRRALHANPELGREEFETAALIVKTLAGLGLEITTGVGETGVIALLRGNARGKTLLLRADMDALPVTEETGLPFASHNGKMHACGHDAHVAILLGAAKILARMRETFSGNIKFVFQPAEETPNGARSLVEAGVMDNPKVDAAMATHVWPDLPSGCYGIRNGPMMAAPGFFTIRILGKGGHGSRPEKCVDPILIGHEIYGRFNLIPSRIVGAMRAAVVTVTEFSGGAGENVVPGACVLRGTTRCFDNGVRRELPVIMEKIVKDVTRAHGASYEFTYRSNTPALVNDDAVTEMARSSIVKIWGDAALVFMDAPCMNGEDFSVYLEYVPGALFFTGTGGVEPDGAYSLHHPKFTIDENILAPTAAVLAQAALDYLR